MFIHQIPKNLQQRSFQYLAVFDLKLFDYAQHMYARLVVRLIVMLCSLHTQCLKLWIKSVGVDPNDILLSSAKVHSLHALD